MKNKTIPDFIHENNCDNYILYKINEQSNAIVSFYTWLYIINGSEKIYNLPSDNIYLYEIVKYTFYSNKTNLIIYLKEDIKI